VASRILTKKLKNGLTLLGEPNSAHQSAGIGFFVKTGARDETAKEAGVSHFLEHMMFKGTEKRSSLDITYELGNLGAQANAYTSEEQTVYYAVVLPEYFGKMQELLSDMLRPSLDPKEFDTEKKVILEEIALYQDKPYFFLYERALRDYYGTHSAGNSVLGTTQSISALSRDEMKNYFDRRYSPSNIVLVATGNFNWEQFVARAEELCSGWRDFSATRAVTTYPARQMYQEYTKKGLNQSHLLWVSEGAAAHEQERFTLAILSMILGDSTGSKMYWRLIAPGLVESAGAESDEKDGTGMFLASASLETEAVAQVSEIMRDILSKPLDFDDADLTRAKTKLAAKLVLGGELPLGRLMSLGVRWLYTGEVEDLSSLMHKVESITRKDIERTLEKYPLDTWAEFRLVPAAA
jgi:predicted Zn-dependent peptidase